MIPITEISVPPDDCATVEKSNRHKIERDIADNFWRYQKQNCAAGPQRIR
jgi:hypothetical protein